MTNQHLHLTEHLYLLMGSLKRQLTPTFWWVDELKEDIIVHLEDGQVKLYRLRVLQTGAGVE